MPITPERKKLYPENWKDIRKKIIERADDRCELCGLKNHLYVSRHKQIPTLTTLTTPHLYAEHCDTYDHYEKPVEIVLTVHHINNDPTDNRDYNLLALEQLSDELMTRGDAAVVVITQNRYNNGDTNTFKQWKGNYFVTMGILSDMQIVIERTSNDFKEQP